VAHRLTAEEVSWRIGPVHRAALSVIFRRCLVAAVLILVWPHDAAADKVPRFASLKTDEANLRTGPGERYPIDWVLTKKGLPVEVVAEFDVWRKVHDSEGSEGWVHQRLLAGSRTVLVVGNIRVLRAEPDTAAPALARAEPGVIARLLECRAAWCRVEAQDIKGWLRRSEVWGVYPDEVVQ
jgi:SH3-like domain-containing protein